MTRLIFKNNKSKSFLINGRLMYVELIPQSFAYVIKDELTNDLIYYNTGRDMRHVRGLAKIKLKEMGAEFMDELKGKKLYDDIKTSKKKLKKKNGKSEN